MRNLKRSLTFSTQTASEVQNLSPAELLGTKKPIQEHLHNRLTSFAQLDLEPGESDDISVVVDKTAIDEAIAELGKVLVCGCDPVQCTIDEGLAIPVATVGKKREVKVALRDSNGELVCGKEVSMTARVEVEEDGSVLPVDIRFEGDGHTLLSFQSVVVGEHTLTIKVKGKQLAGSPYRIWARQNATHESISTGAKQYFTVGSYCCGVAVHHNGDVFASNYVTMAMVIYKCSIVMGHRNCRLVHQAVEMVSSKVHSVSPLLVKCCMWLTVVIIVCRSSLSQESILVSLVAEVQVRVSLVIPLVSVLMVGGVS